MTTPASNHTTPGSSAGPNTRLEPRNNAAALRELRLATVQSEKTHGRLPRGAFQLTRP